MNRNTLITLVERTGYHGDQAEGTRLLIENRLSMEAYKRAWNAGSLKKKQGVPCHCHQCQVEAATRAKALEITKGTADA